MTVALLEPKDITIRGKSFVLSKLPATVGREVIIKYPTSNIPKIGDYNVSNDIMLVLMSYVGVRAGDTIIRLETKDLVNNHVPNAEMLILLEKEMMKYNYDFFTDGSGSTFWAELERMATTKGTEMLTTLLGKLSQVVKPASES